MSTLYHSEQPSPIPNTSGIYQIRCVSTGKFYIGSAVNLRNRWYQHRNALRRGDHVNPKLQNAWDKHGEQTFIFEILEFVLTAFLLEREQYWIDKLSAISGKGLNIAPTAGSRLGTTHSPSTRAKIGAKSIGRTHNLGRKHSPETKALIRMKATGRKMSEETRRHCAETHKGKKRSPETREKMRLASLGEKSSPETCARISAAKTKLILIIVDPAGTEYFVDSVKAFCEEHSLHYSHIIEVAQGKANHHKGWKARFPNAEPITLAPRKISSEQRSEQANARKKTLIVIDPDGVEYVIHGISQFAKKHHLDRTHLAEVAHGKRNHHKGWKARFPND